MNRVIRLFADIGATRQGPVVKHGSKGPAQQIFLRQSSIDSACGPHSLLMALLALGVFDRDALVYGKGVGASLARRLKRRARKFHFTGANPSELLWTLRWVEEWITAKRVRGGDSMVKSFAVENVKAGRPVVLGIGNESRRLEHWVLLVGLAGKEAADGEVHPDEFLILDPDSDAKDCAWNCTIALSNASPSIRPLVMRDDDGSLSRISLCAAIAIARRESSSQGRPGK